MLPNAPARRRELERSLTWPSPLDVAAKVQKGDAEPPSASATTAKALHGKAYEDDLDSDPQNHFLSPLQMYEYEDWADDSDSDGEEVEWDAGITDFALFDSDRRQAQEGNQLLPRKWSDMLARQASALGRAVQRNRQDSNPDPVNRPLSLSDTDVPYLTPDSSPDLRDDLDVESYHGQSIPRPSVPNYLTIAVSPPEDDSSAAVDEDSDLPLSVYILRKQQLSKRARVHTPPKLQRPGMRHTRTMSGHIHAWRRPSLQIYTLGEDSEGENRAEGEGLTDGEDDRGRR